MGTIGEIKVKVPLVKNLHSMVGSLLLALARRHRTIENDSVAKERRKTVKKEKRKNVKKNQSKSKHCKTSQDNRK